MMYGRGSMFCAFSPLGDARKCSPNVRSKVTPTMGICQQSRCLSRPRTEMPGPALNVAASWGLAGCHDTDDTNHGSGDTHKILWSVKMTGRRCAKLAAFSVANENYGSCISSGNRRLSPGLGSPRARSNLAHPTILLLRLQEAVAGA